VAQFDNSYDHDSQFLVAVSFLLENSSGLNCKTVTCTFFFFKNHPGIPLRADSKEQEEGCSGTSYPVETVVLINILEGNDISEVEVDSCVDSKLEEEQVEPGVLLTGQGDSSANGVEDEEEGEEDEEKQINESYTEESEDAKDVRCLSNV